MNKIIYTTFSSHRFKMSKAQGSKIWDDNGKKYIDFTSGWNVTNLGWNNPEVIEAGIKQLQKNSYVPMWASEEIQEKYADELLKSIDKRYDYIARGTSGMESIEMAIKTARVYTGKKKILSFFEQYHGASINGLSLSYRNEWMGNLTNDLENFVKLEYPNIYRSEISEKELLVKIEKQLEEKLASGEFACVITESGIVTGWGSTYIAPKGFIEMIDRICKKFEVLLILDEVGTGFSRTGSLFSVQAHDISPDIIVLAKAIANGTQTISTLITTKDIVEKTYKGSNLQSTFGWNPVACATALKTLEIHKRDKVWELAEKKGQLARKYLNEKLLNNPFVGNIRGLGLEIGLDLVKNKKTKEKNTQLLESVVSNAFENGLHLVSDHESNIQIMPPLVISEEELKEGIDILTSTIELCIR